MNPPIVTTSEIDALIAANAPVAVGVSGGKDSQAAAIATYAHLDAVGHSGRRLLIHSDLGDIEWEESLPVCERLAEHLKTELVIVRRIAGGMVERWETRWESSKRRFSDLETVNLVLPWSTPAMRFCTSELKTHIIARELKQRFAGETYINVTGVRRQESAARAKGTIAGPDADGNYNWRPISDWRIEEVFASIKGAGLAAHRAYDFLSRVSCKFCIMSSAADLAAAAKVAEAQGIYRRLVALEAASTFGFQGDKRWLGDVLPDLLSDDMRAALAQAKEKAARRHALEASLDKTMLFEKGWPVRMLTDGEADRLAVVRTEIASMIGIDAHYLDRASIHGRYAALIAQREEKDAAKTAKADRASARTAAKALIESEAAAPVMTMR
jgi:3'-phosphoadenosine 5'-phosphosulfate sulfotransferase (PAPS reductase)/FAD synthetase